MTNKEHSDSDDDKGVPAHAQGNPARRDGNNRRDQTRHRHEQEDSIACRNVPVLADQRQGVGTEAKVNDVPQREIAAIARQQIPARDHRREHEGKERDGSHLSIGKEQWEGGGKGQQDQQSDSLNRAILAGQEVPAHNRHGDNQRDHNRRQLAAGKSLRESQSQNQ